MDVKDKLAELQQAPDWPSFVRLGNLTKLRSRPDGTFYRANFESGMLLYALVRRFRPARVLEIGTGRGFGAFACAMGLRDADCEGRVLTIDVRGYDESQEWPIDQGDGPRVARLSLRDVWEREIHPSLLSRVERLEGTSHTVLAGLIEQGHRADLIYVDADHSWPAVRHDYLACLLLAARPFRMLLDDYQPRSDLYGVRRLVDEEVARDFEVEAVYTDRRWPGEEHAGVPLERAAYAQVLIDSARARGDLAQLLDPERVRRRLRRHRRYGSALDLVRRVGRWLR